MPPPSILPPLAQPAWLSGLPSPYYQETHKKFQKALQDFLDKYYTPYALEWEQAEEVPEHVFHTFCRHNLMIGYLPAPLPVGVLKGLGIHDILGVRVEEWDYIHTGIMVDAIAAPGLGGVPNALNAGHTYAIPLLLEYGNKSLQDKFLPDFLQGKKRTCIAITEPSAGSDVANISTTATKTPDGKHYIVNGQKKWITNGCWSDYGMMLVRTGTAASGGAGLSIIVCPLKGHPGVSMRRLKTSGGSTSGTTFIDLDEVKVPVENLIGQEGMGMKYIMKNFNHERLTISIGVTRYARVALSMAFEYVLKREAFGKPLVEQPVVRHRLAKAAAELEPMQAWLEQFLYQMTKLSREEASAKLGGLIGLAKAKSGLVLNECAQVAVLLFGGNGFTRSGQGEIVEKIYREVPGTRIPGGSEDVLLDLAVRQMVRAYRNEIRLLERTSDAKL